MKPNHPVDYFVPSYGNDPDMQNVSTSIKNAEKKLKKTMHADFG